ncbi:TPA: fibrinogen-binding protein, partial [Staphylococcus aureus]|nr:fibrinogen-binding protein [Staphylococcus aureus]
MVLQERIDNVLKQGLVK